MKKKATHKVRIYILILFLCTFVSVRADFSKKVSKEIFPLLNVNNSWVYHSIAMLRLERYSDELNTKSIILNILKSQKVPWQTKVFAMRAAGKLKISVPDSTLLLVENPFVMRAAFYSGVNVKSYIFEKFLSEGLKRSGVHAHLIIHESVCASPFKRAREIASNNLSKYHKGLDDYQLYLYKKRLCNIYGFDGSRMQHKDLYQAVNSHSSQEYFIKSLPNDDIESIKSLDGEEFISKVSYLKNLFKKDIDTFVALDGTSSMTEVINSLKVNIVNFHSITSALSQSYKFGIVVYRDYEEGQPKFIPLTDNFKKIVDYIIDIRAYGGADSNEWILSGVEAAKKNSWRRDSEKHLVIIGDAPGKNENYSDLKDSLEQLFKKKQIKTHTIVTSNDKNVILEFKAYAKMGQGSSLEFKAGADVVGVLLKSSLDPYIYDLFEDFYKVFKLYCM